MFARVSATLAGAYCVTTILFLFDLKPKPVEDEPNLGLRRKVFGLVPIEKYLAESKERLLRYQNHLK